MQSFFTNISVTLICIILFVAANQEESEKLIAETTNSNETDIDAGPSDVASVSKFITEFHRQIDDEVYYTPSERQGQLPESRTVDNSSVAEIPQPEKEDEVSNATSLITCNMERQAGSLTVELVNSTRLVSLLATDPNVTSRNQKGECVVLLFYTRTCPFSCMAAPHYNALPRAFPTIKMAAVNALQYQLFNTQYGIVGVPTVVLFHNGRPAAKFNDSEYTLEMFTRFITRHTGILPEEKMFVTSADFGGPVGSVVARETDYWLGAAWLVIAMVVGMAVAKSRMWHSIVEAVQNSWREAEAQHFHTE